ncbi:hypothetical protein DFAR_1190003 [Desulfarculales bacterium]
MQTAEVLGVAKRFEYAIRLGALALVPGDMGSGEIHGLALGCQPAPPIRSIRSSGLPPRKAPSGNFTGKITPSSKWTPPASPGPSSPNSSENRSWR